MISISKKPYRIGRYCKLVLGFATVVLSSLVTKPAIAEHIEHIIHYNPPLVIDYNAGLPQRDELLKIDVDFGYDVIDNPRSLYLRLELTAPTTEDSTLWGMLEGGTGAQGKSHKAGTSSLYTLLKSEVYENELKKGKIALRIGRTDTNEAIHVKSIQLSFYGDPIFDGTPVDANKNNIGSESGEVTIRQLDPDTTYMAEVTGEATDLNGNAINSVSANYVDPRTGRNITSQMTVGSESYLHTTGSVSLYYYTNSDGNTGGHRVTFTRVNLD